MVHFLRRTTKWVGCGFERFLSHFWPPTLPETNIAPKNGWLEYYFPIGEAHFQGWNVSFREGKSSFLFPEHITTSISTFFQVECFIMHLQCFETFEKSNCYLLNVLGKWWMDSKHVNLLKQEWIQQFNSFWFSQDCASWLNILEILMLEF